MPTSARGSHGDADQTSARALVAALTEGPAREAVPVDEARLRGMILDPGTPFAPPALHTALANYHSGGSPDVLQRAARTFGPLLTELLATEPASRPLVLMLILLREHLGPFVDQHTITSLHRATVRSFSFADLSLPYSCAFTRAYDRNREDVRSLLAVGTIELPLPHRVVFEWLTGASSAPPAHTLTSLVSEGSGLTPVEQSRAAARSLLVRHGTGADLDLAGPELADRELRDLHGAVRRRRDRLPTSGPAARAARTRLSQTPRQALHAARSLAGRIIRIPRRRRPRVAVCVSGQLRGYRNAVATWDRTLRRDADCELFVHTWTRIGRSSAESFRSTLPFQGPAFTDAYRAAGRREGDDELKARYPDLFRALDTGAIVTADHLRATYQTEHVVVEDDQEPTYAGWSNQDKMHVKIERAYDLALSQGREYDLIVRLRPDKPIVFVAAAWSDLVELGRDSATILADREMGVHYAHLMIGDQFALGGPGPMSIYSRTATLYPELARNGLLECGDQLAGHSSLAHVCWIHGIQVERAPIRFGALQEASPMTEQEVLDALRLDSDGRLDATDRALIAAAEQDVAAKR